MAVTSGILNQTGLATPYVFTSRAPGGNPPPASAPNPSVLVFTPGSASTGQQVTPATESLSSAGITIPVAQIVGELNDGEANGSNPSVYATVETSAPVAGQNPDPLPTVKVASGAASTGQQPAVTTPFTSGQWATKSVV